jgi:hypothetical protein
VRPEVMHDLLQNSKLRGLHNVVGDESLTAGESKKLKHQVGRTPDYSSSCTCAAVLTWGLAQPKLSKAGLLTALAWHMARAYRCRAPRLGQTPPPISVRPRRVV